MTHAQDLTYTLIAIAVIGLLGAFAFQRHFAVHDKPEPRMVPWMIICLGCVATGVMLVVHLVNLFGFETGR